MPSSAAFYRRGITKIYWVPTIAAPATPTTAEVTAGVDLTPEVAEPPKNFIQLTNKTIALSDYSDNFNGKIAGADDIADMSLALYDPKTGTSPAVTALAKGSTGYLVVFYKGLVGSTPATTDVADVVRTQVTTNSRNYDDKQAVVDVTMAGLSRPVHAVLS